MIKKLVSHLGEYKRAAVLTPLFAALEAVMDVLLPTIMAFIIDQGIEKGDMNAILKYGLLTFLVAVVALALGVLAGKYAAEASTGFAGNLRDAMYENIQHYSFSNIDKFSTAGLVTRMTTDVTNVQNAFQMIERMCVRAPVHLVFALFMAVVIGGPLSLVFVVAVVFLVVVLLNFYQNIDVLLLDDIQELIGMDKTQNTFFHIFNHLHQLGKQLILTSDKPPVDLQGMEERLITRLKWGLTAELSRPDLDLRKKILKNKINHDGIMIPDEVFNFIANNVTENVRDLEGILVSLMANAVINNREIDLPLTKRVVSQAVRLEKKQISVQMIQEIVCKYFNLEQSVIQTNSRKREIVQARQITMYLAKKYTDSSFSHIGKIVGKKDHATVLHACKTIKDQIETSKSFRSSVEEIEVLLKN